MGGPVIIHAATKHVAYNESKTNQRNRLVINLESESAISRKPMVLVAIHAMIAAA
jgi:hypothetical protein